MQEEPRIYIITAQLFVCSLYHALTAVISVIVVDPVILGPGFP